tara:strand:- start:205 stop:378 length:174 start_codon:yes stop_codon:yes gene_type:complete
MIIKNHLKKEYMYIEKKNEKDYYREIIFLKYNVNIDESNKEQSRILIDKIKKIYDKK